MVGWATVRKVPPRLVRAHQLLPWVETYPHVVTLRYEHLAEFDYLAKEASRVAGEAGIDWGFYRKGLKRLWETSNLKPEQLALQLEEWYFMARYSGSYALATFAEGLRYARAQ